MPSSSGEKLCPICDSPLQPGAKKCSFCGTDLSIFDIEVETPKTAPERPSTAPKSRIDTMVDQVFSSKSPQKEPPPPSKPAYESPFVPPTKQPEPPKIEEPKPTAPSTKPEPRPEPAKPLMAETKPSPAPAAPAPEQVQAGEAPIEYFECPQCGAQVESTASSCPKCGVIFAEEGAEMFQCPNCNTLVSVDAKSCPGCGALFVEPGEEEAAPQPEPELKAMEPPVTRPEPPKAAAKLVEIETEEAEAEEAETEKKKGFGWFKRRKKAEEEKPSVKTSSPEPRIEAPKKPPSPPQKPKEEIKPIVVPRQEAVREAPAPTPEPRDKGKEVARMFAEIKPLLLLAMEKDVDVAESRRLIDEASAAGRDRQLDKALELVQKSRSLLMEKVNESLSQLLVTLANDIKVAEELGGDVSRPSTYILEIERAKDAGDIEAAYVYADKVQKELLPIIGRYNESKKKLEKLKEFIADCEMFIVDTKEARSFFVEASKAFETRDFDKVDLQVRAANESLSKAIPPRMNEEMKKAKDLLLEAKMRNANITPMITVLKSATNLMKAGDYSQALKEMREFREMVKKAT